MAADCSGAARPHSSTFLGDTPDVSPLRLGRQRQQQQQQQQQQQLGADSAMLRQLRAAIEADDPAALARVEATARDVSEERWQRLVNQLEQRHKDRLSLMRLPCRQRLEQLQLQVEQERQRQVEQERQRQVEQERQLQVDRRQANRMNVLLAHSQSEADPSCRDDFTKRSGATDVGGWCCSSEAGDRKVAEAPVAMATSQRSRRASSEDAWPRLRQCEAELELTRRRLAESQAETDRLQRRLSSALSEMQFLRNRQRQGRSRAFSDADADADAGLANSVRQSLADLERRSLIDTVDSEAGDAGQLERSYDCLQLQRRRVEAALARVPAVGSAAYAWHCASEREDLEKRLDQIDKDLVHLRTKLRQYHLL